MTHDYKRNGTATLFEALEVLQGRFIGHCHLRRLDQEFPGKVALHLIMDNYGLERET